MAEVLEELQNIAAEIQIISGNIADIKRVTDKLDTILEADGENYRLTADALFNMIGVLWGVDIEDLLAAEGSVGARLAAYFATTAEPAPDLSMSALKICNDALTLLGNNPIMSLTDTTKAARLCAQFYTSAVASTLRAYNWNCATVRVVLEADADAPAFGFSHRFALPMDCLRVQGLADETQAWRVESGWLLTNSEFAQVSYIRRVPAEDMDVMLSEAVAVKLASLIAFPLTNSATVAKAMFDLYKDKLSNAHTMDAFEGSAPQMASDTWIHARG